MTHHQAVVLSNGELGDPAPLRQRLAGWENALIIGADGGSRYAELLGLKLDVAIGDFDSLGLEACDALKAQGVRIEMVSPEKDETDLELALLYAAGWGAIEIVVLGATGGRVDMTMSNLLLLAHPELAFTRVELWIGHQTAWVMRPPGGEIQGQAGDTVSLITISGSATGVKTELLMYPLRGDLLPFGYARGVSNVITNSTARVRFETGTVLVIYTPGRA